MKNAKTSIIRLLTALIPAKGLRRKIRRRLMDAERDAWLAKNVPEARRRYARLEAACREKLAAGGRLSVAFVVCDASMFSGESVFQAMLSDGRFDPFIAVVPRVSRGEEFLKASLEKTLSTLRAKFGDAVRCMYDPTTGEAQSLDGMADLVFTSIAYDDQTLEQYTALPVSRFALVALIPYGYAGQLLADLKKLVFLPQMVLPWRLFVPTRNVMGMWANANPLLRDNMTVCGYPKMDRLAQIHVRDNRPKTLLVCPHHTLERGTDGLELSNFLKYADFFLRLPEEFPDVRFVFRPHPLLFVRLATPKWWGPERTAEYERRMRAHPNVEFQQGGDYFDAFVNSDAMIHDCGSFFGEYFYTGHPQCYLLENASVLEREFTPLGRRMHEHVDHAFCEDDIRGFVCKVVAGEDPGSEDRERFAQEEVCAFHPRSTERVLEEVTRCLS